MSGSLTSERGQTRGLILETVSRNNWRMEGMLPRTFSSGAKLSSFLAGDGSALVGVFDRGQVTIFGPVPWSWKQTGGETHTAHVNRSRFISV